VVPHVAELLDPDAEPEAHTKPWGKDPEDLPMVALTVRGACVFTDKVWDHIGAGGEGGTEHRKETLKKTHGTFFLFTFGFWTALELAALLILCCCSP